MGSTRIYRPGDYLNQWCYVRWCIFASFGLSVLIKCYSSVGCIYLETEQLTKRIPIYLITRSEIFVQQNVSEDRFALVIYGLHKDEQCKRFTIVDNIRMSSFTDLAACNVYGNIWKRSRAWNYQWEWYSFSNRNGMNGSFSENCIVGLSRPMTWKSWRCFNKRL